MTPIIKNGDAKTVNVVDENGNVYEATYPRRAKGLVKNGRARFVSENTIQLTCPPDYDLEDIEMSENNKVTAEASVKKMELPNPPVFNEAAEANLMNTVADHIKSMGAKAADAPKAAPISPAAILERIDKIIADKTHIEDAVRILNGVTENSTGKGTLPHGMSVIVEEREKTNREMISLLRDMYNDAIGKTDGSNADPDALKLEKLGEVLGNAHLPEEQRAAILQTAAQHMFVKPSGAIYNY